MSDGPVNGSPADPSLYRQPDPVAAWLENGEPPTVPEPIARAAALIAGLLPTDQDGEVLVDLGEDAHGCVHQTWEPPDRLARYIASDLAAAGLLRDPAAETQRILTDELRGDGPCDYCGTPDNIVWSTESVFWNEIVRTGDNQHEGFMCVTCFVKRVDDRGYYPSGWRLTPEWHWETKQEREARRDGTQVNETNETGSTDA